MFAIFIFWFSISGFVVKASENESLLVLTKSGPVQGFTTQTYSGRDVTSFYGIPYAEPPVGKLRFLPPVRVSPWTRTLEANKKPCPCYQTIHPDMEEALTIAKRMIERPWCEDCLKLNIWVPKTGLSGLPVIVNIHGGGFVMGSSVHFYAEGHTLTHEENLITVSINYRLSVFGFLALPGSRTPGNVGLMDQQLAIGWIKDNIEIFGGDSFKITLFGVGAGGVAIGLHLLSPGSRGLFQRSFMMSGSPTSGWAFKEPEETSKMSMKLANAVNCQNSNTSMIIDCLQSLSPDKIGEASNLNLEISPKNLFGPTTDGYFLTEHPEVSLDALRFNDADVVFGASSREGDSSTRVMIKSLSKVTLDNFLQLAFVEMNDFQREAVKNFYLDPYDVGGPDEIEFILSQIFGDVWFVCPLNSFADRYFRTGNKMFAYIFEANHPSSIQGRTKYGSEPSYYSGAATAQAGTEADFSRMMMRILGNFARTGDPNPTTTKWPRYSAAKRQYMNLSFNMSVRNNYRVSKCAFWEHLVPQIRKVSEECNQHKL